MTGPESGLAARAAAWRDADPDAATRAELDELLARGDSAALAARFEGSLAFGTAGIRAELGAGPMRMNRLVTARVAAGLARYITASDPAAAEAGIVIGHDARDGSAVFATDAARILSRSGIRVSLLPGPLPTPVLAFAVRYQRAAYGVMVTASHNPRRDNGIKVYVRDGGQLLPPDDERIAAAIDEVDPLSLPAGWAAGPFESTPGDGAARAYVTEVAAGGRRRTGRTRSHGRAYGAARRRRRHAARGARRGGLAGAGARRRAAAARPRLPDRALPQPGGAWRARPGPRHRGAGGRRPGARQRPGRRPARRHGAGARRLAGAHRGRARRAARRRGAERPADHRAGALRSSPPRWSPAPCCAASRRPRACAASPR